MTRFLAAENWDIVTYKYKGPTNKKGPLLSVTVVRYMNQKYFNAMLKILKNWKILASPISTRSPVSWGPARILKSATLHWNIFGRIKETIDIDTLYLLVTIVCHFYLKVAKFASSSTTLPV